MKYPNLNKSLDPVIWFSCSQDRKLYIVNYLNLLLIYSKDASETGSERTFSRLSETTLTSSVRSSLQMDNR